MQNLEFENLIELLRENIVNLKFKKINGDERVMNCTLSSEYIPETKTESKKKPNSDIVSIWSVDDNGWRSFRKDSVINYEVKQ
jgi:WYL_2, Sm-like SH3 beta-barrel fold|nr:MAG: hypothetical protein [Caudoviricetes sp.]